MFKHSKEYFLKIILFCIFNFPFLKSLCYTWTINGVCNMKDKYLIDKDTLVRYLLTTHEELFQSEISRIKLQKSLYFLYAYWIRTLNDSKQGENELTDLTNGLSDKLFKSNFRAWSYGPVDIDVYNAHKTNELKPLSTNDYMKFITELTSENLMITQFLVPMTRRILNTSDFALVDLSHRDTAWLNNKSNYPNSHISHEDIVKDYGES